MSKKPHTKTIRLSDKSLEALRTIAEEDDVSEGEVIRALLEKEAAARLKKRKRGDK